MPIRIEPAEPVERGELKDVGVRFDQRPERAVSPLQIPRRNVSRSPGPADFNRPVRIVDGYAPGVLEREIAWHRGGRSRNGDGDSEGEPGADQFGIEPNSGLTSQSVIESGGIAALFTGTDI